jgi:rare lipoprotein A
MSDRDWRRRPSPLIRPETQDGGMNTNSRLKTGAATLVASVFYAAALGFAATPDANLSNDAPPPPKPSADAKPHLDRTGKKRFGRASFYAKKFAGRKMADGNIMDPHDNNAASKTLPLGTIAKVTNLETGKSAVVTIEDRGPYVDGRIVDLSPATAEKIGLKKEQGVTKVTVAPIAVPLPDGGVKFASNTELANNARKNHRTDWEN